MAVSFRPIIHHESRSINKAKRKTKPRYKKHTKIVFTFVHTSTKFLCTVCGKQSFMESMAIRTSSVHLGRINLPELSLNNRQIGQEFAMTPRPTLCRKLTKPKFDNVLNYSESRFARIHFIRTFRR